MSLYPTTSLIQSEKLQTIDELIAELQKFKTQGANHIDVTLNWEDTYTTCDDALVSLELLEKTLSDGSKIHDIRLNFSENV
jgi:hypothetical protein